MIKYIVDILLFIFIIFYGIVTEIQLPLRKNKSVGMNACVYESITTDKFGVINFLGTNGNHHKTYEFIRQIKQPFILILFDAHSDATPGQKRLKCGNWVDYAFRDCRFLEKVVAVGLSKGFQFEDAVLWNNYDLIKSGKFVVLPALSCKSYFKDKDVPESVRQVSKSCLFDGIGRFFNHPGYYVVWDTYKKYVSSEKNIVYDLPLYISIDLDVLKEVKTPYGSGMMSVTELTEIVDILKKKNIIVGVDICGTDNESSIPAVTEILKCFQTN